MNTWQTILYYFISMAGFLLSIRFFFFIVLGSQAKIEPRKTLPLREQKPLFFSILIPAKQETNVIVKTLQNMLQIDYPKEKQEIIIITDQKETIAQQNHSTRCVIENWIQSNFADIKFSKNPTQSTFKSEFIPPITLLDVPATYDGNIPESYVDHPVPSSKGRALNYALAVHSFPHPNQYCSFFDAETHVEKSIFSYIEDHTPLPQKMPVWQGPALQVRNFHYLSLFSKIAALAQAFSHDFTLPSLLRWIPFLGGTNMHIPYSIVQSLHGFRANCATEDIEMGLRIWDHWNEIPKFLPIVCTEQTPFNLLGYFVQRLRWGKGIIDVLLRANKSFVHSPKERWWMLCKLFFLGPFEWYLYGAVSIFYLVHTMRHIGVSFSTFDASYFLFLGASILFILALYVRYRCYMQSNEGFFRNIFQFFLLMLYMITILPFSSFLYGLPFICGSILSVYQKIRHKEPSNEKEFWKKTPRTTEV
jgi:cellulose synthase/poly-beta-1,6-N-acetylglucosamine synthase-like glycosyltransferase